MDGVYTKQINLHSTMFLLKRAGTAGKAAGSTFTFHNVSIKTEVECRISAVKVKFTFHNVSIKTSFDCARFKLSRLFTFHNVSIKTWKPPTPHRSPT